MKASQYRDAGVDLDQADRAKRRIAEAVASTHTAETRGLIGAFGGMVSLPPDVERPVLVMSTDSVGTKVLVAVAAKQHRTIGEWETIEKLGLPLAEGAREYMLAEAYATKVGAWLDPAWGLGIGFLICIALFVFIGGD